MVFGRNNYADLYLFDPLVGGGNSIDVVNDQYVEINVGLL